MVMDDIKIQKLKDQINEIKNKEDKFNNNTKYLRDTVLFLQYKIEFLIYSSLLDAVFDIPRKSINLLHYARIGYKFFTILDKLTFSRKLEFCKQFKALPNYIINYCDSINKIRNNLIHPNSKYKYIKSLDSQKVFELELEKIIKAYKAINEFSEGS